MKKLYIANLLKTKEEYINFKDGGFDLIRDFGSSYEKIGYIYAQSEASKIEDALNTHDQLLLENKKLRDKEETLQEIHKWCLCNIESGSMVANFCVDIRDLIDRTNGFSNDATTKKNTTGE